MRVYKAGDSTQQGMVAIVITMLVITIIAMMVLTFARVIRRDTRQTIDRQLSAQALYAAETGVNDVVEIDKALPSGDYLDPKTNCDNTGMYAVLSPNLDGGNVAYTCVLVDPLPELLKFSGVEPFESQATTVEGVNNYSQITIEWQAENPPENLDTSCTSGVGFKTQGAWGDCNPLIRVDLVPISGVAFAPNNLYTAFIFPSGGGGTAPSYGSGNGTGWGGQGVLVNGNCQQDRVDGSLQCRVVIPVNSGTDYRMRIMPVYKTAELVVSAQDAGGDNVNLEHSQYVIDVTGRAQDVLRRVRIHHDAGRNGRSQETHSFGLQTEDTLCKLLSVVPGDTTTADAACPLP